MIKYPQSEMRHEERDTCNKKSVGDSNLVPTAQSTLIYCSARKRCRYKIVMSVDWVEISTSQTNLSFYSRIYNVIVEETL